LKQKREYKSQYHIALHCFSINYYYNIFHQASVSIRLTAT
jgi:hypothetical protein